MGFSDLLIPPVFCISLGCCIYEKPKLFGESSDEDSDDDHDCTNHCRGHKKKCYQHGDDEGGEGGGGGGLYLALLILMLLVANLAKTQMIQKTCKITEGLYLASNTCI